jgi:small subunit ribosomal protein S1
VPLEQAAPISEEDELRAALGGRPLDELMLGEEDKSRSVPLEPETRLQGRVIAVGRGEVFFDLGRREQGSAPLHQFPTPPAPGTVYDLIVQRLNVEEGLYEVSLCLAAVPVEDWSQVHEGMLVEARVTGHNAGGLECQVNNLRGFIPFSQIALYRVEDPAQFVGQSFLCLVTEANQQRRNLVLSRRAVLEREREEARQQFFQALQPGEVREGVVCKLLPFGAFVDLGGVDGLLPISQLAWRRVEHPSEVLSEGQRIKVKIEKIDPATGKISLAYRDLLESPWARAAEKYPPNVIVRGKVRNITNYGAFVELEPGIEGLLHISELSHKKVWKVTDVVKEGEEVDVLVLAIDAANQRISLSMRALLQPSEEEKAAEANVVEEPAAPPPPEKPKKSKHAPPLTGGLGRAKGWNRFDLKW